MCCLLYRKEPLLSEIYFPAGYFRILTESSLNLFINEEADLLESHSNSCLPALYSFTWLFHELLLMCPAERGADLLYSSHTSAQFTCHRPFPFLPSVFLLTLPKHFWFLAPSPCFLVLSFPLNTTEYSSDIASRDARAVPQPEFWWLLVIGGTWQLPEIGTQTVFIHRSP